MAMLQPISVASDRVLAALIAGLELEFGHGAGEALAQRFLAAEDVDFRWDARVRERWLGSYRGTTDDDLKLDQVLIFGRLDAVCFVATMIVDGDGGAHGMLGCRTFRGRRMAEQAFDARR